MDKYCTNCGHEVNNGADYCLNCGKRLIKNTNIKTIRRRQNSNESLNIIGMVLSIISFLSIFTFSLLIGDIIGLLKGEYFITKLFVSIFWISIFIIPIIIGFVVSIVALKKEKTIYGIVGIITSIVSFTFVVLTAIYLIK